MFNRFSRRINWAHFFPENDKEKKYSIFGLALGFLGGLGSLTSEHLSTAAKVLYLFALPLAGYGVGMGVSRIADKDNNSDITPKSRRA